MQDRYLMLLVVVCALLTAQGEAREFRWLRVVNGTESESNYDYEANGKYYANHFLIVWLLNYLINPYRNILI